MCRGIDSRLVFGYIDGANLCMGTNLHYSSKRDDYLQWKKVALMRDYWAWGGKYIGFSESGCLYSKKGTPIGYINANEVFSFSGKYLCDIMEDRLIVKMGKCTVGWVMAKPCKMCGRSYADYAGYAMYAGYQDFVWNE